MKISRVACVAVTGLTLCLPSTLFAHGGQYRGPGDTVPPGGGGGGGRTPSPGGPTTPGPGGPTTPTPGGPTTPGPQTPAGPAGGGPRQGPTTGGPGGIQVGDDLTQWQFYWEFNKDPFLQLRAKVHSGQITTGSDDFVMGRGLKSEASDTLKPNAKDLEGLVIPALKKALNDKASNRDIVSSSMIALAKIGRDSTILESFKKFLPDGDQEIRETACLAMGIAALPGAVDDLISMATDDQNGRKLSKRASGVDFRSRSFACYGLGLIAWDTKDIEIKKRVFEAMKKIVEDKKSSRRDIQIAALNGMRLLRPNLDSEEGKKLHAQAVDYLLGYLDKKGIFAQIQSHAVTALANLCGHDNDPKGLVKARILKILKAKRQRHWMYQSAILGLGQMGKPDDTEISKAIQDYAKKGKDQQAKFFTSVALGHIGGEKNRDFLRKRLKSSKMQTIQKPWIAMGLGIMDYNARQADSSRDIDSTAMDIQQVFKKTKNPIFSAGLAIALGMMRDKDAGDMLLERMIQVKNQDEAAGYMAVGLGLMGFQEAKEFVNELVEKATRRPQLLTQCSIALGLLGDKEISLKLIKRMRENNTVAVFSALAQALGFIGDRRSLQGLVDLLGNKKLQPLSRAFSAVALGLVGDKELYPWNSKISVNINYRANVETLTGNGGTGVLDIL